jgi:hypothetical protein
MDSMRGTRMAINYQPPPDQVAGYIGELSQELETLAASVGLNNLAAYLRAAVWEARAISDGDPSRFRRP